MKNYDEITKNCADKYQVRTIYNMQNKKAICTNIKITSTEKQQSGL